MSQLKVWTKEAKVIIAIEERLAELCSLTPVEYAVEAPPRTSAAAAWFVIHRRAGTWRLDLYETRIGAAEHTPLEEAPLAQQHAFLMQAPEFVDGLVAKIRETNASVPEALKNGERALNLLAFSMLPEKLGIER